MLESLFNKVADPQASNVVKKETSKQLFSCESREFFKNTFFKDYLELLLLEVLTVHRF